MREIHSNVFFILPQEGGQDAVGLGGRTRGPDPRPEYAHPNGDYQDCGHDGRWKNGFIAALGLWSFAYPSVCFEAWLRSHIMRRTVCSPSVSIFARYAKSGVLKHELEACMDLRLTFALYL